MKLSVLRPSDIAAVTLIRNEAELIGQNLRHLFGLGMRHFVVADHGSTDHTLTEVRRFRAEHSAATVMIIEDPSKEYRQAEKMNSLAALASDSMGARWIYAFDADDFLWWPANGPVNLPAGDFDYIRLPWLQMHPARMTVQQFLTAGLDQTGLSGTQANVGKTIVRWLPDDMYIERGQHFARSTRVATIRYVDGAHLGLAVAHFPVRSCADLITRLEGASAAQLNDTTEREAGATGDALKSTKICDAFMRGDREAFLMHCREGNIDPLASLTVKLLMEDGMVTVNASQLAVRKIPILHRFLPPGQRGRGKNLPYLIFKRLYYLLPQSGRSIWWHLDRWFKR